MAHLWDTMWTNDTQFGTAGDWAISTDVVNNSGGFQDFDPLGTAIVVALFSNARLPDHLVDNKRWFKQDQRDWHGNHFSLAEGEEPLGSLLFTLRRRALTDEVARIAEHYASVALQPLIKHGHCSGFNISSEIDKDKGQLTLHIVALGKEIRTFKADLYALR